jgi:hypothetical protein
MHVTDLLAGIHTITVGVTDSEGAMAMDEVTVFVDVIGRKVYLPIIENKLRIVCSYPGSLTGQTFRSRHSGFLLVV